MEREQYGAMLTAEREALGSCRAARRRAGRRRARLLALPVTVILVEAALAAPALASSANAPVITTISPSTVGPLGAVPASLEVAGTHLDTVTTVLIEPGDINADYRVPDENHLTVTVPAGTASGDHWLLLRSPDGTSDPRPGMQFRIAAPAFAGGGVAGHPSLAPAPTVPGAAVPVGASRSGLAGRTAPLALDRMGNAASSIGALAAQVPPADGDLGSTLLVIAFLLGSLAVLGLVLRTVARHLLDGRTLGDVLGGRTAVAPARLDGPSPLDRI